MKHQQRNLGSRLLECPASSEVITALGLAAFAVCGLLFINSDNVEVYPGPGGMTWQTLPMGYAWALLALSAIYLLQSLNTLFKQYKVYVAPERSADEISTACTIFLRRIGTIVLLIVYIALIGQIGFAIATPPFLLALLRLYKRGSLGGDIAVAIIGALALWVLFVPLLKLNLKGATFDPVTPMLQHLMNMIGI